MFAVWHKGFEGQSVKGAGASFAGLTLSYSFLDDLPIVP